MSIKVLIDTIMQLPDMEMIRELIKQISNQEKLVFSDPKKLFSLILILLSHVEKEIVMSGYILINILAKRLLSIYLQNGWNIIGKKIVELLGCEDGEIRKKSEQVILLLIKLTENPQIYLDTLLKGMENTSPLRIMQCVRILPKLLELYPKILNNKKSVSVVKSLIEKIIEFTKHKISNIERESKNTLVKLYHIKLESLEEVILRLNPQQSQQLHKLWEKQIQNQIHIQSKTEQLRFQQFPIINNKIFGLIDSILIERLLNSTDSQERNSCIIEFSFQFHKKFEQLSKYCSIINKLLLRLLQFRQQQVITMLSQLYSISNIKNKIKISQSIQKILSELGQQKASWRKSIRQFIIQILPINIPMFMILFQKTLASEMSNPQWFKIHQILLIYSQTLHFLPDVEPSAFDNLISILGELSHKHKVLKIKKQCINILGILLASNQQYKELMVNVVDKATMCAIQQHLESILSQDDNQFINNKQQQQQYMEEYESEKTKYNSFKNQKQDRDKNKKGFR